MCIQHRLNEQLEGEVSGETRRGTSGERLPTQGVTDQA